MELLNVHVLYFEGKITFVTICFVFEGLQTNDTEKLDPALIIPGRMDIKVLCFHPFQISE
jgi:hypothetical protein